MVPMQVSWLLTDLSWLQFITWIMAIINEKSTQLMDIFANESKDLRPAHLPRFTSSPVENLTFMSFGGACGRISPCLSKWETDRLANWQASIRFGNQNYIYASCLKSLKASEMSMFPWHWWLSARIKAKAKRLEYGFMVRNFLDPANEIFLEWDESLLVCARDRQWLN